MTLRRPRPPSPKFRVTEGSGDVLQATSGDEVHEADEVLDEGVVAYMSEHANEIAAEADHVYQAYRRNSR